MHGKNCPSRLVTRADMDMGPFLSSQPNPLHVVSRPKPAHQTRIIMTKIYISFVFIQAIMRHKIQLAATVMHERLITNEDE